MGSGLTITGNSSVPVVDAASVSSTIRNYGDLTLRNSTVSENVAINTFGAFSAGVTFVLFPGSTLRLGNSIVSGNFNDGGPASFA